MRTILLMLRLIYVFVQLDWYTRVILIELKDNKTAQLIIFCYQYVCKHTSFNMNVNSIRISVKSDYLLYCRNLLVWNTLLRNSPWNRKLNDDLFAFKNKQHQKKIIKIFYKQELNWFFNISIIFSQNNGVFLKTFYLFLIYVEHETGIHAMLLVINIFPAYQCMLYKLNH